MEDLSSVVQRWWETEEPITVRGWYSKLGPWLYGYLYNDMLIDGRQVDALNVKSVYQTKSLVNFTGETRLVGEMGNNEELVLFMMKSLLNKEALSLNLVKRFNKLLIGGVMEPKKFYNNQERPGEFRRRQYNYGVGKVGAPIDQIEGRLQDIVTFMSTSGANPLKVATVSHCMFEDVHPFASSNGRTGRILMNYFLILNGYPPIIIKASDQAEYFSALRQYDVSRDAVGPMYELLKRSLIETWQEKKEIDVESIMNSLDD